MTILLKRALDISLDVLGEPSKQALLYYLQERHNISIQDGGRCFSLEEVETALNALLGAGSLMIIDMVKKELGTADNKTGGSLLTCLTCAPVMLHVSYAFLGTRL